MIDKTDWMIRLLRQGYGEFDAKRSVGPACWPHHDLFFVHRGALVIEFPATGEQVHLHKGEGVLIWPATRFRGDVVGSGATASIQHFAVEAPETGPLAGLLSQRGGWSRQTVSAYRRLTADVERALEGERPGMTIECARRGVMRLALLELVLAQAGMLDTEDTKRRPRRLDEGGLQRWLRENLRANPGVAELAVRAGLSLSRFRAVFKEENGRSAGSFVRAVREAEARRFLTETNEPLKVIAALLGHADAVVFSRAFKQATGRAPGAYRTQYRIRG